MKTEDLLAYQKSTPEAQALADVRERYATLAGYARAMRDARPACRRIIGVDLPFPGEPIEMLIACVTAMDLGTLAMSVNKDGVSVSVPEIGIRMDMPSTDFISPMNMMNICCAILVITLDHINTHGRL